MNDNNRGWDGPERREIPYEETYRLAHIEQTIAVMSNEINNMAATINEIKDDLKAARTHNWPEWAGVAVSLMGLCALAIGMYVSPLEDRLIALESTKVRQWEEIQELNEKVAEREGVIQSYNDHLTRYHSDAGTQ